MGNVSRHPGQAPWAVAKMGYRFCKCNPFLGTARHLTTRRTPLFESCPFIQEALDNTDRLRSRNPKRPNRWAVKICVTRTIDTAYIAHAGPDPAPNREHVNVSTLSNPDGCLILNVPI